MKISYSFGMVDLLHFGHIRILEEASKNSDLHIFGLVSDKAVLEWTGLNISNYEERKSVLKAIRCIDLIYEQKTLDPLENLMKIHDQYPDAEIRLFHGNEWKIIPSEEFLHSIGGKVISPEYYQKLSRDKIIESFIKYNENRNITLNTESLFASKATTLLQLKKKLVHSMVEEIKIITVSDFLESNNRVVDEVKKQFEQGKIIIRSSSTNEDSVEKSNAGKYSSVLNVEVASQNQIVKAIEKVISSYGIDQKSNNYNEQILIQRQTVNVGYSGVIFTRDIRYNRPYYTINYDESGSTDSVTSGQASKSILLRRNLKLEEYPERWRKLILSVREIELLFDSMLLDIEFAVKMDGEIVIFQVRPLVANYGVSQSLSDEKFYEILDKEQQKYLENKSFIDNQSMVFSDMAFWNPSEIIGDNPRSLEYSLYCEIITKSAWNKGLLPLGYREVDQNLMYRFLNKPYISVNYTFWSLIPIGINEECTLKLYNYYLKKIIRDKTTHDKVEFEIILSCYDFETEDRLLKLKKADFSDKEIEHIRCVLKRHTSDAINQFNLKLKEDLQDLMVLENDRKIIVSKLETHRNDPIKLSMLLKGLLESVEINGTCTFSRQARYAFIAKAFCNSLVKKNYFLDTEMEQFQNSIVTVATEFDNDLRLFLKQKIKKDDFNEKYGHLRLGTYDVRADRYDQLSIFNEARPLREIDEKSIKPFILNRKILLKAIKDFDLSVSNEVLSEFLKVSIEQREYFKFIFTKSLSLAIEIIIMIGQALGYTKSEMSYIEISDLYSLKYYSNNDDIKRTWDILINERKSLHNLYTQVPFPDVITSELDLKFVQNCESRPNFITTRSVHGEVIHIESNVDVDIEGKIVLIKNADPGYDWIFTRNISGLITQYGGVASHMAIRCAEFGIPAAIGCGAKNFNKVKTWKKLELDCANGKLIERC